MSNTSQLLTTSTNALNNSFTSIQSSVNSDNLSLTEIDQKNNVIEQKEKIQVELLYALENKEKILLTRSRMLQIAQDRNSYKLQSIYASFAIMIVLIIIILIIFIIIRKKK